MDVDLEQAMSMARPLRHVQFPQSIITDHPRTTMRHNWKPLDNDHKWFVTSPDPLSPIQTTESTAI
jgi:hypothetical protein